MKAAQRLLCIPKKYADPFAEAYLPLSTSTRAILGAFMERYVRSRSSSSLLLLSPPRLPLSDQGFYKLTIDTPACRL